MMDMNNKKRYLMLIGVVCGIFRRELGYRQEDVARDIDVAPCTISRFESGENDSITILTWYVDHGLDLKSVLEYCHNNVSKKNAVPTSYWCSDDVSD